MRKASRKCAWNHKVAEDLIDIILENEKFKEKLLLTTVTIVKS